MAKKRSANSKNQGDADSEERLRLLKAWFTEEEVKQVRVAAAIAEQSPGEFVREAALQAAAEVEQDYIDQRAKD